jgi:hypothetical protein
MPSEPSVAVDVGQQVVKGFEARHAAAPCRERWRSALTMEAEASHLAATKRAVRERRVVKDFRRSIVDFGG